MIKNYMFYTEEGYTESPKGIKVQNFQILGFESAENYKNAKLNLLQNNPWILGAGFNFDSIEYKEILQ